MFEWASKKIKYSTYYPEYQHKLSSTFMHKLVDKGHRPEHRICSTIK